MLRNRATILAIFPAAIVAVLVPMSAGDEARPFRYSPGRLGKQAELKYVNEVPVLIAGGTPEEIGTAVGALALKSAPRVLGYPRDLLANVGAERVYPAMVRGGLGMYKQFPTDYRAELEALVKAAGVEREAVVVGNTMFDLHKSVLCSALVVPTARSTTGGPLLARNLDYPSLGYIHEYTLVTIYRPAGKHAFASIGFPGVLGCLSGINDAGLALSVLEVYDAKEGEPRFDAGGIPYALCQRKLLEECTTIAETKKLLEGLRRTTTTNLVVADRTDVAVLEVTPARVVRRDVAKNAAPCTNHFCSAAVKPAEPLNVHRSFERFASLDKVRERSEKLGIEDLRQELDAVNLGTLTLQAMVFEPAALRLHLSCGHVPASEGPLRKLDLGPLLRPIAP